MGHPPNGESYHGEDLIALINECACGLLNHNLRYMKDLLELSLHDLANGLSFKYMMAQEQDLLKSATLYSKVKKLSGDENIKDLRDMVVANFMINFHHYFVPLLTNRPSIDYKEVVKLLRNSCASLNGELADVSGSLATISEVTSVLRIVKSDEELLWMINLQNFCHVLEASNFGQK